MVKCCANARYDYKKICQILFLIHFPLDTDECEVFSRVALSGPGSKPVGKHTLIPCRF